MPAGSSFIYSSQSIYQIVMRLLYGRYFRARYEALAAEIPRDAYVIDLCAGDCYLFRYFLREKDVQYLGLELSPQFVRAGQTQGIPIKEFNVWHDEIPSAEIVLMQASLYQFLPHAETVVRRMLKAARRKVLIAEPIRNLSSGKNWLGKASRILTKPRAQETDYSGQRFDEQSLRKLFNAFPEFERAFLIPGGREMIGVFRGEG